MEKKICLTVLALEFLGRSATASLPVQDGSHIAYAHPKSYYEAHVDLAEEEDFRIRKHLATVEEDLRRNPPPGLTSARLSARLRILDHLRDYRMQGIFPRNRDFADSLVPYFIDAEGVPCAVGRLIIASGHRLLAEEIARTRNHAYIPEIRDARLGKWARESGFTQEELARIQPGYGGPTPLPYLRDIAYHGGDRIWVRAREPLNPGPLRLAYLEGKTWTIHSEAADFFCLDPSGQPLLGTAAGYSWQGKTVRTAYKPYGCDWTRDGHQVLVLSDQGIVWLEVTTSGLIPVPGSRFPFPAVRQVHSARNRAWVAAPEGVASQPLAAPAWKAWSADSLGGSRVTGLAGNGGDTVWAGLDGNENGPAAPGNVPQFTRKGLRMFPGASGPVAFTRGNSSLPSDTVDAVFALPGPGLWLACPGGIYEFTPPSAARKLAALQGKAVNGLARDSLGRLLASTWGQGLFRLQGDSLVPLGYPIRYSGSVQEAGPGPWSRIHAASGRIGRPGLRTLLGRSAASLPGTGFLMQRPGTDQSP